MWPRPWQTGHGVGYRTLEVPPAQWSARLAPLLEGREVRNGRPADLTDDLEGLV